MAKQRIHAPDRSRVLFDNLFKRRQQDATLQVISLGLNAVLMNVNRLMEDVKFLAGSLRYGSAAFLLATANEELAKCYILMDMCRLDFSKHHDVLKHLCRAFYSHVAKHGYIQLARDSTFYRRFDNLSELGELWDAEVQLLWPSEPESGEPDLPHDTYFTREVPLYVDFVDYDQQWFVPEADTQKHLFKEMAGDSYVTQVEQSLLCIRETSAVGLFAPTCLSLFNDTFRKRFIKRNTPTKDIFHLYDTASERLEKSLGIPEDVFRNSALFEWPLYPFLSDRS